MRTFGYEAEFQTNAPQAYAALHQQDLTPTQDMHRWHCDCSGCSFGRGNQHPFRGQTDSSCSGEIISSINRIDDGMNIADAYLDLSGTRMASRDAFEALQTAAVEQDAEPGSRSGFHVHVGVEHLDEEQKIKAVYNLCRWENVLYQLAAGSLPEGVRSENIRYQTDHLAHARQRLEDASSIGNIPGAVVRDGYIVDPRDGYVHRAVPTPQDLPVHLYQYATQADRHSSLNLRTNHGTWEYRLWNSTRSAWRMEMFCGLSLALIEPEIIGRMDEVDDDGISLDAFESIIDDEAPGDLGEMVRRQRALSVEAVPRFTQLVTA